MPQSAARLAPAQYTFSPGTRQLTFSGVPGFTIDGLMVIVNGASGKVIFDPEDESGALGYSAANANSVTLAYDTTGMSAADPLKVYYNDLVREDQLITFAPTVAGPLSAIATKSYQSAVLDVQSTTSINGTFEGSVDGIQWKAIMGQLPNLDGNPGDTNWNNGAPFNMRQYDITPYYWVRINPSSVSAGTPKLNLLLKTVPAPLRKFIANGGSLIANFDSGGSVGYVRTTSLYTESSRLTLTAGQVVQGANRYVPGQPNPYFSRFATTILTDQNGTLVVELSLDGTNWIAVTPPGGAPVTGGTPFDLEVKIRAGNYRSRFTNGGSPTGANAFTMLTAFCSA